MKKFISILLITVMVILCISACGQKNSSTKEDNHTVQNRGAKIKVVTTIFPEYDWVKEIAGDEISNMDLTMLLDNGVDLHSYQPTASDIMKISDCDLFIYVGGESDAWVDDALKEAVNKNMKVINLLDVLGNTVKEEEVKEGMEAEEEEESGEEEEEPEYDEHVWLSLKNAKILTKAIAEDLCEIDEEHKDIYMRNEKAYEEKLASFETVKFLSEKVDELGLKNVITIEKSDQKIAKTIVENTKDKNQNILTLDSMQSTLSDDVKNGTTYLSVMKKNLEVLKEALQ